MAPEGLVGMAGMESVAVPVEQVEVPEWGWGWEMVLVMALVLEPAGLDCHSQRYFGRR